MPVYEHPILDHAEEVKAAINARDAKVLNDVIMRYARAYKKLESQISNCVKKAQELGEVLTLDQLKGLQAYRSLLAGVKSEMSFFADELGASLQKSALNEVETALLDTMTMTQAALPGFDTAVIRGMWARLSPEQVYQMIGFLDENGPLFKSVLDQYGKAVADMVADVMATGFITGQNPITIARLMSKSLGVALNWSLTTVRTANLWAYRSASQINYLQNSHIIKEWMWYAQLDDTTCLSCVFQHGTVHPVTEILMDHHCGRCAPLPITKTYAELGFSGIADPFDPTKVQTGEQWFNALPIEKQIKMMGPAKFAAWMDNAFEFSDLSVPYIDAIYGIMIREPSLIQMLGKKAEAYYQ